ncbi:DUF1365 domain-containing protein [Leeia oryzae]|uniref:DUF1365 domain-containing protein n=1 Tax=Leeia oryzae TaxID=356662 RepID=UPI0003736D0C|nr:DUF1365 domain-containing protein [Leeia oryzae]
MKPAAILIRGQVMHHRLRPAVNRFVYPVFCVRLNLDRLNELSSRWFGVNRWRPLSIRTADYGPRNATPLAGWMREVLTREGVVVDGEIWLQTFPRVLGFVFNPVSFWFCHDRQGGLKAVLAEVNNTFGEHHHYLLTAPGGERIHNDTVLLCRKLMHVSPFCPVEGRYAFRFRESADHSFVGIDYHDRNGLLIKTSIGGHKQPFAATSLRQAFMTQPLLTLGVVARIHWQALRLWLKKVPFFRKPAPPVLPFTKGDDA